MTFQDTLDKLSTATSGAVMRLWELVEAGAMTQTEFTDAAAVLVEISRRRGAAAGWAALRAYLEAADAAPVAAVALDVTDDVSRLKTAVGTILVSQQDTAMQLARLAANEPLQAATSALSDAMRRSKRVRGWTRKLEPGACQLCQWWAREDRIWQPHHKMARHPGCTCHQKPVLHDGTGDNVQTTKQAKKAKYTNDRREGTNP
ncbi:MAG: hypothetical protein ACK5KO_12980 [Arachnia sp.]